MISELKNLYKKDPILFWVYALTSCLIFCYLIILLALNDGVNLSFFYGKIFASYNCALNILEGRDVFAAFNYSDIREVTSFPSFEVISAYLSKYSGIDLILSGRIVNFLLFLAILCLFFKYKKILKSYILIFVLIYFLISNIYFLYVLESFHPEIMHFFLMLLSVYLFYNNKLFYCYVLIFVLSILKTPFAFALVTFLTFEYYFNNNLYKENIFKLIKKEKIKILFIFFLLVPVFVTEFYRGYLLYGDFFSFSPEIKRNEFPINTYGIIAGLLLPLSTKNITSDATLYHNLYILENLFLLIFPLCAIVTKNLKLLIKTICIFLIFLLNFYMFLVLYQSHSYSMLGLGFVFITILMVSYKDVFNKIINKYLLVRNRFYLITILFFPFFIFKLLTLYAFAITNFSENKVVTLAKNFTDKNKEMLVVNSHFQDVILRGTGIFNRQNIPVNTYRIRWDCDKFIKKYDQIFLMLDGGCISELLLAEGNFYIDIKHNLMSALWVKDERLKKREVTDKIEINNFYRDDTEFDIEKAKKDFTNIVYQEENIKLYRKDEELFYIVENCISKKLVENNIKILVYYDFLGSLKILLEDGYSKLDRILPRQDINILGDSMIENDTCYGKKKIRHANNIKEIKYLPSRKYNELIF